MRSYKTEGIVIKRTNFSEADRILTVFTKKHGKIKMLAKGVRRITSKRGPNIEVFNEVSVFIHHGKTFDILTEVELQNSFSKIRKNLDLVGLAFHVCELVDNLCPENEPHPQVYENLREVLSELDSGLVNKFERNLLIELGYLPKSKVFEKVDTTSYVEKILEKKLKTKRILSKF
jgi:DNA repair protein RecO (recombination protein O)